jgi:transcriptional regulator with XRE-family HTH domain
MMRELLSPVEKLIYDWERGVISEEQLGAEIRTLRRRLRIPLRELAQRGGLTIATLSSIERSKRPARIDSLGKVFAGLREIERARREQHG